MKKLLLLPLLLLTSCGTEKTYSVVYCRHNNGTFCDETTHISDLKLENVVSMSCVNLSLNDQDIHYHYMVVYKGGIK